MPKEKEEFQKEIDELVQEAEKDIEFATDRAKKRILSHFEMYKNAASLVFPIDAVETLRHGGVIIAKEITVNAPGEIDVEIARYRFIEGYNYPQIKEAGKYKLIVILQKLQ